MKPTKTQLFTLFIVMVSLPVSYAVSHCQIPCGIYDDHSRVKAMLEDTRTITKAINFIEDSVENLGNRNDNLALSYNQTVRWVNSKDAHAENIISTISNYFLTQRVKPGQENYLERLASHHKVMVTAMKAKQKVSLEVATDLEKAILALEKWYPKHEH